MKAERVEWTDRGLQTTEVIEIPAPYGLTDREYAHLMAVESRE